MNPICKPVAVEINTVIGIDPGGSSGAICVLAKNGICINCVNMPDTHLDLYRLLCGLAKAHPRAMAYVEDVGGTRPGNSAKSARSFAEHCGALDMALLATGIAQVKVLPRKWMLDLFGHGYPTGMENLKARKDFIYERMQRRWPGVAFTKRQADAVAIATWGMGK